MRFIIPAAPRWDRAWKKSQNPDCNPDPALPLTSQQPLSLQIIFIAPFGAWEYPECEVRQKNNSHLTCNQTSGTSSQRFWLLCPPAESYRTRTTNASPPAHLFPWQPTLTHHPNKHQTQACLHKIISENDPSPGCRRVLWRLVCATVTKRITVTGRKDGLTGINRGICESKQGTEGVCWWSSLVSTFLHFISLPHFLSLPKTKLFLKGIQPHHHNWSLTSFVRVKLV